MNRKKKHTKKKSFKDGYVSLAKKMGTVEDLSTHTNLSYQNITGNTSYLEHLYDTMALFKNIINIPVNDAMKEGRELTDTNLITFYAEYNEVISHSMKMARIYGGCYIYMADDRSPEEPLLKGNITSIHTLMPIDLIHLDTLDLNPISKGYLTHASNKLTITGEDIDPSRLIYIDGEDCSNEARINNDGLGLSVFESLSAEVHGVYTASNRSLNILDRLSQDVLKLEGLNEALTETGSEAEVTKKLTSINAIKNIMSTLAIDKEDSYENVNRSLSGVPDIITEFKELVSSASRIPYSKLFGTSSTGLNATGENEVRNYYDEVKSIIQNGKLRKIYLVIDEAVTNKKEEIIFNPIYTPSNMEIAETRKVNAEAVKILIEQGVIEDDESREIIGLEKRSVG